MRGGDLPAGAKVGAFVAGLLVVGVAGAGVGALVGPIDTAPSEHDTEAGHTGAGPDDGANHDDADDTGHDDGDHGTSPTATTGAPDDGEHDHGSSDDDHGAGGSGAEGAAPGTSDTQDGYRLDLEPVGDELRFQVLDPEGEPVVATEVVHEKPLHLIVVGQDLIGYAHLHPEVDADGTWSVARPPMNPGGYRVIADLTPVDGPALVLAADLVVPGQPPPGRGSPVPEPGNPTTVDDLTVTFDGHPGVGDTDLAFTVTRDGEVVEPEPYLGARGHLVAIRADDLAYTHVHPHDDADGPVMFTASFPGPGLYRLFLDLQVDGVVRTFGFTVEVSDHEH